MQPISVTLARHAEYIGNLFAPGGRVALGSNVALDLTRAGERQAEIVGAYFRRLGEDFDVCYHSTFVRSKRTAQIIISQLHDRNSVIRETPLLDEIRYRYSVTKEMEIRSFLVHLEEQCRGKRVLVIVHGIWLLFLQMIVHKWTIRQFLNSRELVFPNCGVTIYRTWNRNLLPPIVPWEGMMRHNDDVCGVF